MTWLRRWGSIECAHAQLHAFSPEVTSLNVTCRASPGSHVIGSALGVLSRMSASYYRFLALSLVIYPFPAILLASLIITQKFVVFGYVIFPVLFQTTFEMQRFSSTWGYKTFSRILSRFDKCEHFCKWTARMVPLGTPAMAILYILTSRTRFRS